MIYNDIVPGTIYTITVTAIVGTPDEPVAFESEPSKEVLHQVSADALTLPVLNLVVKNGTNSTCVVLTWMRPPETKVVTEYFVQEASGEIKPIRTGK